jgi:DNA-binding CsgD family transcriptional regulator
MDTLLYIVGCLPLAMPALIIYRYLRISPAIAEASIKEETPIPARQVDFRLLLPFVFAIYAVGGLMYSVIGQISTPPGGLWYIYSLIPYIIFLLVAGPLGDNYGRRLNGLIGAILVGIGFMLIGLFRGVPQYLAAQTLLVGGYAFLDTFSWVIAADVTSRNKIPLYYGIILSANILAILTGVLLGGKIGMLVSGSEVLTVSLAGLFSFISLVFIFRLGETLPQGQAEATVQQAISIEELAEKTGLTHREADIGKLLIAGKTTPEILEDLAIAPDTLKTHLRNIYRKVGAKNRLDFTLRVMKGTRPAEGPHAADSNTDS